MTRLLHTLFKPDAFVDEELPLATLRAVSCHTRCHVSPLLTEALEDCGCWTKQRCGDASGLYTVFEVPLREVAELYPSLLECGLEFDRRAHCELALLCTVGQYALERESMRRNVTLRLELTFLDELDPALRSRSPHQA